MVKIHKCQRDYKGLHTSQRSQGLQKSHNIHHSIASVSIDIEHQPISFADIGF